MTAALGSGRHERRNRGARNRMEAAHQVVVLPRDVVTAHSSDRGRAERDTACAWCGFALGAIPPDDLVAAVLSIPAQYREVLGRAEPVVASEARVRTVSGTRWSVVERVVHVADWFHVSARAVTAMVDGDADHCSLVHVDAARAGANGWPVQVALGSLVTAAAALGRAVSSVEITAWDQSHDVSGTSTTIRAVVEHALHEARHHLLEVAAALDTLEARPPA